MSTQLPTDWRRQTDAELEELAETIEEAISAELEDHDPERAQRYEELLDDAELVTRELEDRSVTDDRARQGLGLVAPGEEGPT